MNNQNITNILTQYPNNWNIITILNGEFLQQYSQILSNNLIVKTSEKYKDDKYFSKFVKYNEKRNDSVIFNTESLSDNIIEIELTTETKLDVPVVFLHIIDSNVPNNAKKYQIFFCSGENSFANIYDVHTIIGENKTSTSKMFSAVIKESSIINYTRLSNNPYLEEINLDYIYLSENSQMNWNDFILNTKYNKEQQYFLLEGKNATLNTASFSFLTSDDIIDKKTEIYHDIASTKSNQLVKTIAGEKSKSLFDGKIVISEKATDIDAKQLSRGILLNTDAEINLLPQLEIYNDDVICSHGSAVGSFDEDLLFYLNSRGIGKIAAEQLLMQAFAGEVIDKLPDNEFMKERIKGLISEQLR